MLAKEGKNLDRLSRGFSSDVKWTSSVFIEDLLILWIQALKHTGNADMTLQEDHHVNTPRSRDVRDEVLERFLI